MENTPRKIQVYTEILDVYQDGKVFADGDKLVIELEFDVTGKTDEELRSDLETILHYDKLDNE